MQQAGVGITGIILAGGKNSRMGMEKALLQVGPYLIIERIAGVLRKLVEEIIIVTDRPEKYASYGDRTVSDVIPGCGPLGGIYTGLMRASYPQVLVTACDMPFVSEKLGRCIISSAAGYQAVVPCYAGYPEPLFALYDQSCLKVIKLRLAAGLYRTTGFYDLIKVRFLEEKEMAMVEPQLFKAFFNVNTPEDLEKAYLLNKRGS